MGNGSRHWRLAAAALSLVAVSGCATYNSNPEASVVNRLVGQGYDLIADGRLDASASTLRYSGAADNALVCSRDGQRVRLSGSSAPMNVSGVTAAVSQRANADVHIVVNDAGAATGLAIVHTVRDAVGPDGTVVGRQLEWMEFAPGRQGTFRNNVSCALK